LPDRPGLVIPIGQFPRIDQAGTDLGRLQLGIGGHLLSDPLVGAPLPHAPLAIGVYVSEEPVLATWDDLRHRQPSFLLRRLGRISNPRHSINRSTESRLIPRSPRMNRQSVP